MAFFCYSTGEIASHFEHGSETHVKTDANLCSFTFTDAVSAYTGKPEHWLWKDAEKMDEVEIQALQQLRSASGRTMIRITALAEESRLKNMALQGLPPPAIS